MRGLVVLFATLSTLTGPASIAGTGEPTVETLLAEFSHMPGLEARFREEKRIALLVLPLVSEGTIHFAPPARLVVTVMTGRRRSGASWTGMVRSASTPNMTVISTAATTAMGRSMAMRMRFT